MITYHAATAHIEAIDRDICLTDTADDALTYLQGRAGRVYEIRVANTARYADADILTETAEKIGVTGDYAWDLADDDTVRKALAADGWQIIEYVDDQAEGSAHDMTCYRVLDPAVAEIVSVEEVA